MSCLVLLSVIPHVTVLLNNEATKPLRARARSNARSLEHPALCQRTLETVDSCGFRSVLSSKLCTLGLQFVTEFELCLYPWNTFLLMSYLLSGMFLTWKFSKQLSFIFPQLGGRPCSQNVCILRFSESEAWHCYTTIYPVTCQCPKLRN